MEYDIEQLVGEMDFTSNQLQTIGSNIMLTNHEIEVLNRYKIPYSNFLITVFWYYGDMEVGLQSVVKKWVPDWTLNVLDENPSS